jgi:hypothetical protein
MMAAIPATVIGKITSLAGTRHQIDHEVNM